MAQDKTEAYRAFDWVPQKVGLYRGASDNISSMSLAAIVRCQPGRSGVGVTKMETNQNTQDAAAINFRAGEHRKFYPVSNRTWARWKARGLLPFVRVGRVVFFNKAACDRALAKFQARAV